MTDTTKPSRYFTVFLRDLPSERMEELTEMVFADGAAGTEEALSFSQPDLQYEAEPQAREITDLKIYFLRPPSHELLAKIHNIFGCAVHVQEDEHKDWLHEWKKSYEPFPLAGPVWVVPNWRPKPNHAEAAIFLEPGMAFGTGTHATTQLAAKLLAQLELSGRSLLDVGTGTGILAMLGEIFGSRPIWANDADPEAVRTARENIERNASTVHVTELQVASIDRAFDVVVANIIDGVLLKLRKDLLRLMAPGGDLILSGILLEREAQFVAAFLGPELELVQRLAGDEWVSLHLRRS